jgi:nucleotide-binding universal stress UspA family protein
VTTHARPIVVPLDGSKNAETALPAAAALARSYGAPLVFLHVLDPDVEHDADLDRSRQVFEEYTAGLAKMHGLADHPHESRVVKGSAANLVIDETTNARLIVLASHGRGGMQASFIGSVADKIVRGAKAPVLVIPLGSKQKLDGAPIVVALDGSTVAEEGLAMAREIAGLTKAKVVLCRAYSIPPPAGIEFVAYPVDLTTTLKEAAEEYLAKAAQPGEQTIALMAPPVQAITEAADHVNAGLVVMTAHGKGFAQRIALGSVTDRAMHSIRRPLLIVPPAEK